MILKLNFCVKMLPTECAHKYWSGTCLYWVFTTLKMTQESGVAGKLVLARGAYDWLINSPVFFLPMLLQTNIGKKLSFTLGAIPASCGCSWNTISCRPHKEDITWRFDLSSSHSLLHVQPSHPRWGSHFFPCLHISSLCCSYFCLYRIPYCLFLV